MILSVLFVGALIGSSFGAVMSAEGATTSSYSIYKDASGYTYASTGGVVKYRSADSSAAIRYAVNNCYGTITFSSGTYILSSSVEIHSNLNFVGQGIGKTIFKIKDYFNTFDPFYCWGTGTGGRCTNFYMTGITCDGNYQHMSSYARTGWIYCNSVENFKVENCEFKNEAGNQVIVANSYPSPCKNVVIQNNIFTDNNALIPRDGNNIRITGSDVHILNNVFTDATAGLSNAMDMNIDNSVISGNTITGCRVGIVLAGEYSSHGNTVVSNNFFKDCSNAIQFWTAGSYKVNNIEITSNTFQSCSIDIAGSHGTNVVESYSTSSSAKISHIYLSSMVGYRITGSTIQNVAGCGIRITGSSTISVTSCTIKACSSYAIYIKSSVGVTISGCSYANNWVNVA
jgi:parallel beta-helix repeat protein